MASDSILAGSTSASLNHPPDPTARLPVPRWGHRYAGVAVVTYLDDIVAAHRATAQEDARPLDPLVEAALRTCLLYTSPSPRD